MAAFARQRPYCRNAKVARAPCRKNTQQLSEVTSPGLGIKNPFPIMATFRWHASPSSCLLGSLILGCGLKSLAFRAAFRYWAPPCTEDRYPSIPATPAPQHHLCASHTDFLEQQPEEVMMHLISTWTSIKWERKYGMPSNLLLKNACLSCPYLRPMNGFLFVSVRTTISEVFSVKSMELLRIVGMKLL